MIIIDIYEPNVYYYKWSIEYKGKNIENNSGNIQLFISNIENIILKLNGVPLSYKEKNKILNMYNFFN